LKVAIDISRTKLLMLICHALKFTFTNITMSFQHGHKQSKMNISVPMC